MAADPILIITTDPTTKVISRAPHSDAQLSRFIVAKDNPTSLVLAARTAVAAVVSYLRGSVWTFGIAVLLIGLLFAVLRVERSAYRYATTALVIVMLVTRSTSAWSIAFHRFSEVSIGIAVGLVLSALWPERQS